jgi:hypothetical protein
MCVRVFLYCAVLCRKWPRDGPIPPSKESYQLSKYSRFIIFRSQILNRKRPEGLLRIYFKKYSEDVRLLADFICIIILKHVGCYINLKEI